MKKKINATAIADLKPGQSVGDSEVTGFRARRLPSGLVSFGFQYRARDDGNRLRWITLDANTPDAARKAAKIEAGKVAGKQDPALARDRKGADTLAALLDNWQKRHVEAEGLRSATRIRRSLDKHVVPMLGRRRIYDLKRRDITDLLDSIEDNSGRVTANRVLSFLRTAFIWQMKRDDDFMSPVIKGMERGKRGARTRTLNDDEIRDLWQALDTLDGVPEWFATFVRTLLLTGQRKGNVGALHTREIQAGPMLWVIPAERRRKLEHGLAVPLSKPVRDIIASRGRGYLFVSRDEDRDGERERGERWARPKRKLDAALAELRKRDGRAPMPHWVFHDLRRTARSIMSRFATPDIAERVIGHRIGGVRGVYDLYEYLDEKRDALDKLARYVLSVAGVRRAVVPFPKASRRGGNLARATTRPARARRAG